ncbi:hypothetical protein M501DRAFT_1030465 [Patellaria atrata CBS 101060]|uniref:Uncharacterized protein n=1 Tax=Patellaria atrata CBS 101060 TaxID=1346257 RepID=A0A9P4SD11_9PEZI|nr:hypothetical protein M501DRAFT_1030465 [Patellaria atrata CBS 101060]
MRLFPSYYYQYIHERMSCHFPDILTVSKAVYRRVVYSLYGANTITFIDPRDLACYFKMLPRRRNVLRSVRIEAMYDIGRYMDGLRACANLKRVELCSRSIDVLAEQMIMYYRYMHPELQVKGLVQEVCDLEQRLGKEQRSDGGGCEIRFEEEVAGIVEESVFYCPPTTRPMSREEKDTFYEKLAEGRLMFEVPR